MTGDPVLPTSEKLDPCSRIGVGGRRPIFSTVEKSVGIACRCAHTVGGGVGARCGTWGFHDRQPFLADVHREIFTF